MALVTSSVALVSTSFLLLVVTQERPHGDGQDLELEDGLLELTGLGVVSRHDQNGSTQRHHDTTPRAFAWSWAHGIVNVRSMGCETCSVWGGPMHQSGGLTYMHLHHFRSTSSGSFWGRPSNMKLSGLRPANSSEFGVRGSGGKHPWIVQFLGLHCSHEIAS